jgi:hypothetical protein
MWLILKDEKTQFVWDEESKQMYQYIGENIEKVRPTLEELSRFRPYIELVRKQDKPPVGIETKK